MSGSDDAVVLIDAGLAALDEGRWRDALSTARRIKPLRDSAWFEIAARALWELGRPAWAIATLEHGVAVAPQVRALWHWLACYRSDHGAYEGALEAFGREAALPGAMPLAIVLNRAIVLSRMGRHEDALALVEGVQGDAAEGPAPWRFMELRAQLCVELERYEDALAEATAALALGGDDAEEAASIRAVRAYASLVLGDRIRAAEDLRAAVESSYGDVSQYALIVARSLEFRPSAEARHFELYCCGRLDDECDFIVRADALAEDAAEALRTVVPFVPEASRPDLRIDEALDHGPPSENGWSYADVDGRSLPLKGLYALGRFHAFPRGT